MQKEDVNLFVGEEVGVDQMLKEKEPKKKVVNLDEQDRRAEMALLVKLESIPSAGGKRDFCEDIGCPWDEYLRLKRKWRVPLEKYRKEQELQ
jgi:hypothetical protein